MNIPDRYNPRLWLRDWLNRQTPTELATKHPRTNPATAKPGDVSELVWRAFIALRKAQNAPITSALTDHLRKEAEKAGIPLQTAIEYMLKHGWRSFSADWLEFMRKHAEQAAKAGLTPEQAHDFRLKHDWRIFDAERYSEMMAINPPPAHHENHPTSPAVAAIPATPRPPAPSTSVDMRSDQQYLDAPPLSPNDPT